MNTFKKLYACLVFYPFVPFRGSFVHSALLHARLARYLLLLKTFGVRELLHRIALSCVGPCGLAGILIFARIWP